MFVGFVTKHGVVGRIRGRQRLAFTLIEVLVVVAIVGLLITILGTTVSTSIRKAREAATTTLILKIDGLLDERIKGFERATKTPAFTNYINTTQAALIASGVPEITPDVLTAIARKNFFRQLFPQRFEDLAAISPDANTNGVPDILEQLPGMTPANISVLVSQAGPGNRHRTESSELLYYALTQMQSFGVPPVGESEFLDSEARDTDGDGLKEFLDGWDEPLRFYRWPTRLLKPNGPFGGDGVPGNGGASLLAYGTLGTDDVALALAPRDMRPIAGLLMSGLAPTPAFPLSQWDSLSEDPDDGYGLISTWVKSQYPFLGDVTNPATVIPGRTAPLGTNAICEPQFPTLDTYHAPLVVSGGSDRLIGLFEPYAGTDSNGDGVLDADLGILAQPIHGAGGPFDITTTSMVGGVSTDLISPLTDNLTNRNRRAGKRK